ncbi:hypothetical protein DNTS_026120 [Danionella cerebrum]|uniref:Calponin-homology (CH) domain-containing protein n=1 Tax=Danionella cerebrum TaxID=2873325 RepID=A0A553QIS4_9TELE|nr:hypothetical protein DNTS_026120 [Danionella translucida]
MASSPQKSPSSPKSPTPKSPSSRKKDDSFLGKLGGTLVRRKKAKEVSELQEEGMNAINLPLSPTPFELHPEDIMLEENEVRTMVDPNSKSDRKLQELMKVEKLEGEKLNVAEVTQSEIAQKQKLQTVLERINDALKKREGILQSRQVMEEITGNTEALSGRHERDAFDTLFDHAPDKLNVVKKTLITFVNKHLNKLNLEVAELDTQFADGVYLVLLMGLLEGYFVPLYNFFLTPENFDQKPRVQPAYLGHIQPASPMPNGHVAPGCICNLPLNRKRISAALGRSPLIFRAVHNVSFSFELMQDGGLERPKPRPEDIVNCDLKSTLRVLYNLFTRYRHVE